MGARIVWAVRGRRIVQMFTLLGAEDQPAKHRPSFTSLFAAIAMAICGLAIGPELAEAATATGNLTVQLTITSSCTIAATTLSFGSAAGTSLLAAALTANTTVSVTCTNVSPYAIGMGQGLHYSSGNQMANGSNNIDYGLYTKTRPWPRLGRPCPAPPRRARPPMAATGHRHRNRANGHDLRSGADGHHGAGARGVFGHRHDDDLILRSRVSRSRCR